MRIPYVAGMKEGQGYDPHTGGTKGLAVKHEGLRPESAAGQDVVYFLTMVETNEEFDFALGIDFAARTRGLLWDASGQVELRKAANS